MAETGQCDWSKVDPSIYAQCFTTEVVEDYPQKELSEGSIAKVVNLSGLLGLPFWCYSQTPCSQQVVFDYQFIKSKR